jgi:sulfate adenylyltransferase subunit 1
MKLATRDLAGQIKAIEYQVDVNTLEHKDAERLELNAIGRCQVELTAEVPVDDYRKSPGTGSFIVVDRLTNVTVGAGMIRGTAKGSGQIGGDVDWQGFEVELNALVRKYFPHWEAKDVSTLLGR